MCDEAVVHLEGKLAVQRLDILRQQAGIERYNDLLNDFARKENPKKG